MKKVKKMKKVKSVVVILMLLLATFTLKAQEIFNAVKNDDLTKVKALIEKDASVIHLKDNLGNSPLHVAAIDGSVPVTELLLLKGADINSANTQLNTPLHLAIMNGNDEVSKLLIEKGPDLSKKNIVKKTPLHLTVRYNRINISELLIAKGSAIDSRDDRQRTPFSLAARETGNVDMAKLLIQNGADINIKDVDNNMPLNFAAWKGYTGIIDLLLDKGADFDTTQGRTSRMLRYAADCGSARLFEVVSDKGEDLFAKESGNDVTMRAAIAGGSIDIVKMLLAKNIQIKDDADIYGWTPMHFAANNGHLAMIKFLAEKGSDINKRTLSGKSPYNLAEDAGKKDALKVIIELGGSPGPQQFPELKGPYFGQDPPGNEPKIFAPDIVATSTHSSISVSSDGKEIYWGGIEGNIWMTKLEKDKWIMPEIVSFSRNDKIHLDVPFLSPDNRKMFFTLQPVDDSQSRNNDQVWFVERTGDGWSEPQPVSSKVNSTKMHWQFSVSNSGTLYFSGLKEDGFGGDDIYYSRPLNGEYTEPVNLGSTINNENNEIHPFIAPDESYLIFCREGEYIFHISFKGKDGQWLQPKNFGQSIRGNCPIVSPDGKYLFYIGDGIQWISAKFIDELASTELNKKE